MNPPKDLCNPGHLCQHKLNYDEARSRPHCGWPLSLPLLDASKAPPLLPNMSRSGAKLLFGEAADKASASVGKRTDYLAAGEAAGRKLTKSWQLGVSAIGEAHLHKLPSR
ncbi:MAG: hypothetical protein CM15mP38_0090 [Synechococcus sp.]|nr:MAG: hypothetical protein CM15mP38_0090 [Synechococcus sp.]